MALFSSYLANYGYDSGVGKTKRHLLDKVTLAVQAETPFMDMISRAKMNTPTIEWIEEELRTGDTTAVPYGVSFDDLSDNHKSAPSLTQRSGYAEQFAKGVNVTDEQETADKVGVKSSSEMNENLYTKMIEIKTTVEAALLQRGAGGRGSGTGSTGAVTSAAALTGYFNQLNADVLLHNTANGTASTAAANWRFFFNNASGSEVDAMRLIDRLAVQLYNNGGMSWKGGNGYVKDANCIIASPNVKYLIDRSLDERSNVRRDIGGTGMMLGIMFTNYKTSYGDFKIMPDLYLPGGQSPSATTETKVAMFNPQNWALAVNKDFYVKDIATIGLNERKMISARFGLIHRHRAISGGIDNILSTIPTGL